MKVLNTLFISAITLFCLISSSTQFANLKKTEIETSSFLQMNKVQKEKTSISNSANTKSSEKSATCTGAGCAPEPKL